jgi:hypothetical protein
MVMYCRVLDIMSGIFHVELLSSQSMAIIVIKFCFIYARDPPLTLIMDFSKLEYSLQRIASKHDLPAETVLERWLEQRGVSDPDGWRELDGIPCIVGGLVALLGEFRG